MTTLRPRKDNSQKEEAATSDISMAALTTLLEDHKAALSSEFKSSMASLESKIDLMHTTVLDHGQRINSLETNANLTDERLTTLEATCAELEVSNAKLKAKASDLESRSRRANVRLIGLPESIEGPRPTTFLSTLLQKVMGEEVLPKPPKLDRAHRMPFTRPKSTEKPRTVIMCFHSFQTKERVMREARRRRGQLRYEGKPIAFYEDYPADVLELRSEYREVMSQLYDLGLKPSLQYPARLKITTEDGNTVRLSSVQEAKKYIADKRNTT